MAEITVRRVPREHIHRLWPLFYSGVAECLDGDHRKPMDVLQDWLSPAGEELYVAMLEGKEYLGFATLQFHDFGVEKWCSVGLLFVKHVANIDTLSVLSAALPRLEAVAKARGCTHFNYLTTRRGFAKIAKSLGFHQRFVEWTKELS